nr:MAG TPA: hypothetical protein [Caudoviricetes sp.]
MVLYVICRQKNKTAMQLQLHDGQGEHSNPFTYIINHNGG